MGDDCDGVYSRFQSIVSSRYGGPNVVNEPVPDAFALPGPDFLDKHWHAQNGPTVLAPWPVLFLSGVPCQSLLGRSTPKMANLVLDCFKRECVAHMSCGGRVVGSRVDGWYSWQSGIRLGGERRARKRSVNPHPGRRNALGSLGTLAGPAYWLYATFEMETELTDLVNNVPTMEKRKKALPGSMLGSVIIAAASSMAPATSAGKFPHW